MVSTAEDTPVTIDVLLNDSDADNNTLTVTSIVGGSGPMHGNVTIQSGGEDVLYVPDADFCGTDEFSYEVSDGQTGTDTASVTLTVACANNSGPVAENDVVSTAEDTPVTIDVLLNDSDADNNTLTVTSIVGGSGPMHGNVTIQSGGEDVLYVPDADFCGTDEFSYEVSDGQTGTDTASVTLTVACANNSGPVAENDVVSTAEDTPVTIDVLLNDSDADNNTLTVTSIVGGSGPMHGNVTIQSGGEDVLYVPDADFCGTDEFSYEVSDGQTGTDTASVTLTVACANNSGPVAENDVVSTAEDTPVTIDVLLNDSDADNNTLTVTSIVGGSGPMHGNVTIQSGGEDVLYVPDADFCGTDEFSYEVSDGQTGTDTASVTLTVACANNSGPVAENDVVSTAEDTPVTIDVLLNDSDADNNTLTVTSIVGGSGPMHGNVTIQSGGEDVLYVPDADFCGTDEFSYEVSDGQTGTDTASVTLTVACANNSGPVAENDVVSTAEDTPVTIDVLLNDSDADNNTLTVTSIVGGSGPMHGNVTIQSGGEDVLYVPDADFCGTDEFSYEVSDGQTGTDTASVTLTVACANNSGPVAENDVVSTAEDTPVTIDVLLNDSDADNNTLTVTSIVGGSGPMHGNVTIQSGGEDVLYVPDADFCGTDEFSYEVSDGQTGTDTASVTLTVACANNSGPVAENDVVSTAEDTPVTIDVLLNDSDADNNTLTVTSIVGGSGPMHGNVTIQSGGEDVLYVPDADFCGTDEFSYEVSDGQSGTDTASVTLTVACANNSGPVAENDVVSTAEDTPVTIDVLLNDSDADNNTLTVTSIVGGSGPMHGNVTIQSGGEDVLYVPDADFCGTDEFSYEVSDGQTGTDTASVTLTVACANNSGPVAENDVVSTAEDTPVTIDVLLNDSDADNNTLTVTSIVGGSGPMHGNVTIQPGGEDVLYVPDADFCGTDEFSYEVSDGQTGTDTASVTLTVACANNSGPVAENDVVSTAEDTPVTIDVLLNDSDADNNTLTVTSIVGGSGPMHGNVTIQSGGEDVLYVPDADFCGTDEFSYEVSDGQTRDGYGQRHTPTVACANNSGPVAEKNDVVSTAEDTPVTIDVLLNDSTPTTTAD